MEIRVDAVAVHVVEHGTGRPVLVLHGAGVDHREAEACLEPALDGLRRIYPDLPGLGRTVAPDTLRSARCRPDCATSRSTASSPDRGRSGATSSGATS